MDQSRFTKFQTLGLELNEPKHSIISIVILVINILTFAVMMFINAAAAIPSLGVFKERTGDVSNRFEVDITPAGWTFSTWGIIYAWTGLWLFYNAVLIFIRSDTVGKLYQNPPVFTIAFHLIIFFNFSLNIAWLFTWDGLKFGLGFFVLLGIALTLYAAIILSHKNIYDAEPDLRRVQA